MPKTLWDSADVTWLSSMFRTRTAGTRQAQSSTVDICVQWTISDDNSVLMMTLSVGDLVCWKYFVWS